MQKPNQERHSHENNKWALPGDRGAAQTETIPFFWTAAPPPLLLLLLLLRPLHVLLLLQQGLCSGGRGRHYEWKLALDDLKHHRFIAMSHVTIIQILGSLLLSYQKKVWLAPAQPSLILVWLRLHRICCTWFRRTFSENLLQRMWA